MSTLEIFASLRDINTRYSVFEPDQVLTHEQLNSIANYLSDQARLSRVQLLGVGIGAGLRVTFGGGRITVSKGIGLTTDGDLFHLGQARVFDRFKPYDQSKPKYDPFYIDDTMITVYELVEVGEPDDTAQSLTQFDTETGQSLKEFVALLFMESYLKDDDLCSGTDCDNLGQDYIDSPRVLMVEKTAVERLQSEIPVPHQAFEQLEEIVAPRPTFSQTSRTIQQIASAYRGVNNSIRTQLNDQFARFWAATGAFLTDVFAADPTSGWQTRLTAIHGNFDAASEITGIQYYYDFLKDVVETYNHFRELLFGEFTWLCPDTESFPKHLLLGNVVPTANANENRTLFYPSPLISQTTDSLHHAQFLAQKIDTLLQTFMSPAQLSAEDLDIIVTPSRSEAFSLEQRAIPYYYADSNSRPIHQRWNYHLHQRRMDAYNYSYNAAERYGARGGAANPLNSQMGKFDFFRIEGHLGKPAETALETIEQAITDHNLPFTVRAIMAETQKTNLIPKKRFKYTDLHRFHYLLRQDVYHQLGEVAKFSEQFKQRVDTSVNNEDNADALKAIAKQKDDLIHAKTNAIQAKLNLSYLNYQPDSNWQIDVSDATRTAGEFKSNLGAVVKTDFSTPFDSLISSTPIKWIDWLDEILKQKEDKEDDRQLFQNFIIQHPALEHFGGVNRGGTFVLVYNNQNRVVADFMLPYFIQEPVEEPVEEPTLSNPPIKPDFVVEGGIQVTPSFGYLVNDYFVKDIAPDWENKIDYQKEYFQVFQDSVKFMSETVQKDYLNIFKDSVNLTSNVIGAKDVRVKDLVFRDDLVASYVKEIEAKQEQLVLYQDRLKQSDLPDETRSLYESRARTVETELAQNIIETMDYVAVADMDVATGSDGYKAILKVADSLGSMTNNQAVKAVNKGLASINDKAKNPGLKTAIGNLLNR
jgi:hypothetical protein